MKLLKKIDDFLFRKQRKGIEPEEKAEASSVINGYRKAADIIAPSAFERTPDYLRTGSTYNAGLMAVDYPRFVRLGWLSRLFRHAGNVDLALHIRPVDPRHAIDTLTRKIAEFQAVIRSQVAAGKITDPEIEAALKDAEELRARLQFNEESLIDASFYVRVFENDPKAMEDLLVEIEYLADAADLHTRRALFRQQQLFDSTLPLAIDTIGQKRSFTSSALATTFPFVSPQLSSSKGTPILLGMTEDRSLVMFDIFSMPSFNSCIIARTGAGKSYLAKLLALRHFFMGVDIVVIDPKGEYGPLAHAVGGQVIKLSMQSGDRINIFDVDIHEGVDETAGDYLSSKIVTIFRFLSMLLKREVSSRERNILLKAIEQCYAERDITRDPESLYEDGYITHRDDKVLVRPERKKKQMPTLSDLGRILREQYGPEGAGLAEDLDTYINGIYSKILNAESNVNLDNRFIIFDISDLEEELAQYATFVSLEWLWTRIKRQPKKRLIMVDEAWKLLLQHDQSGEYLAAIARTARQFWGGLMVITQQPKDVLDSEHGRAIITNAEVRILLRQDWGSLNDLEKLFSLSEEEKAYLSRSERGSALLIAGNEHIAVHNVKAFDHEHPLITTDPQELESLRQKVSDQELLASMRRPEGGEQ